MAVELIDQSDKNKSVYRCDRCGEQFSGSAAPEHACSAPEPKVATPKARKRKAAR